VAGQAKDRGPRILGGRFRGRQLTVPRGLVTRPARALVRRSVFDILQDGPVGAAWLDLYAGSGSFGIEALSRGARVATFVEGGRAGRACLQRNLQALGVPPAEAHLDPRRIPDLFLRGAPAAGAPFAFISMDPPFAVSRDPEQLARLVAGLGTAGERGWWTPAALLIWEEPADAPAPPVPGFAAEDRREYGTSRVRLLRFRS